nr:uncharacterized protein LOC121124044 [Lepeophtheirus salmonis]
MTYLEQTCNVLASSLIDGKIAISLETSNSSSAEHFTCFSSVTYSCSNLNAYCGESCDPNSFGKLYTKLETLLLVLFFCVLFICIILAVRLNQYKLRRRKGVVSKGVSPTTLQNEEVTTI